MFSRLFVIANNLLTRLRRVKVPAENLLLLVPSCLQKTGCAQTLGETIDDCNACGQCGVADLLAIRDEFGIHCSMAAGGREALAFVRDPKSKRWLPSPARKNSHRECWLFSRHRCSACSTFRLTARAATLRSTPTSSARLSAPCLNSYFSKVWNQPSPEAAAVKKFAPALPVLGKIR